MTPPEHTRDQAIVACQLLEAVLAPHGVHVALGGSVLTRGTSEHDIDIMLYPHKKEPIDREWLVDFLRLCGFIYTPVSKERNKSGSLPDVIVTRNNNLRYDFFILSR